MEKGIAARYWSGELLAEKSKGYSKVKLRYSY
jgi:hypothetical protein